jgi:hypothetical protein
MADSSRVRVSIVAESTFGVTPATPTMLVLPVTGASMEDQITRVKSNVLNSTRNVQDLVRLSKSAGGGLPCELRYSPNGGGLNAAIAAVMCSTYTAATTQVTAVTATVGSGRTTLSGGSGNVETGIEVGDIVRVLDSNDVLIAYDRVYSRDTGAHTITLETDAVTAGLNRKVLRGARIKNGTAETSFTVEVAHLDLQFAHIFTGQTFNTADITVGIGSLTTINFGLVGKSSTVASGAELGYGADIFTNGATYTAAASHPTLDPIGVQTIYVGGSDYAASSLAVSWNNNVRARERLGALGPQSMAFGTFDVTGRVRAYLEDFDDHEAYAAGTESDLWYVQLDANNRGYSVSYPRTELSKVNSPTEGNDSDIYKNVEMTALEDATEACSVRLQRWGD